jgi:hypothetical protein
MAELLPEGLRRGAREKEKPLRPLSEGHRHHEDSDAFSVLPYAGIDRIR